MTWPTKELLAASGVRLPIDLTIYATQDPVEQRDVQILQANVAEAGINLAIEVVDEARYKEIHQPRPDGSAGDFDVQSAGGDSAPIPISISGSFSANGSWNWGMYSNPELRSCLWRSKGGRRAKRIGIFREIAELLIGRAGYSVPLRRERQGVLPCVEGFVHRADGLVRYVDIGLRQ